MGTQENGSKEMRLSLGGNNKYKRMDSQMTNDDTFGEDYDSVSHQRQMERRKTTRKYVFACSVFASLNNVLLGYGNVILFLCSVFMSQFSHLIST